MSSQHTPNKQGSRFSSRRQWLALCVAAAALVPALTSAQQQIAPVILMKSGFHSIPAEHFLMVTAGETGASTAQSEVTIEP